MKLTPSQIILILPYRKSTQGQLEQANYVIVPLSPKRQLTAELASRVNDLIERYRGAIEAWTEGGWEVNANGDMQVAGEVDRGLVPRTNLMGSLGTATKKWKGVFAELFTGNLTGNVTGNLTGTASKATGDADGNAIKTTYAKLASPTLTGTPTAPTAVPQTMTDQMATTKFVNRGIASTPCYYSRSAPFAPTKTTIVTPPVRLWVNIALDGYIKEASETLGP